MTRYLDVLRAPHVAHLVAAAVLARIPIGINALAMLLYLRQQTGSFAVAGLVSGSFAAGTAIGAPVNGRLVDRHSPSRALPRLAVVHAGALAALLAFGALGAPAALLVVCAALGGASLPPSSSVLRGLWSTLMAERRDLVGTAYALDMVMIEIVFISGPLIVGVATSLGNPAAALGLSIVAVVSGTAWFSAAAPVRGIAPAPRPAGASRFGALASPGIRTLVATCVPAGIAIGMCQVAIPAFARAQGDAAHAGLLLAVWSTSSAFGGIVYGLLPRRVPLRRIHLAVTVLLPLMLLPLSAASSVPVMALLAIPAGSCIAPLIATRNELVGAVAPAGARTEAYTWPITAFVGGISAGTALAGALADGPGWQAATLTAAAIATLATLVALVRNRTLVPVPAP